MTFLRGACWWQGARVARITWPICYLHLRKVSANGRRCYISNIFSHWLRPCWDIGRKQAEGCQLHDPPSERLPLVIERKHELEGIVRPGSNPKLDPDNEQEWSLTPGLIQVLENFSVCRWPQQYQTNTSSLDAVFNLNLLQILGQMRDHVMYLAFSVIG